MIRISIGAVRGRSAWSRAAGEQNGARAGYPCWVRDDTRVPLERTRMKNWQVAVIVVVALGAYAYLQRAGGTR